MTRRYQQEGLSLKRESVGEPPQPRLYYRGLRYQYHGTYVLLLNYQYRSTGALWYRGTMYFMMAGGRFTAFIAWVTGAAGVDGQRCTFSALGFESNFTSLSGAAKVASEHVISEAQRRAYASLIARMEAKEAVLWLGLGGSHFGGRKCADKRNIGGARCSYSFQLASSLRERYYGIKTSPHDDGGPNSNLTAGLVYRNMATSGAGLSQI